MTEGEYLNGQSNNIFGAQYTFDAIDNTPVCLNKNISITDTLCPCKAGYHIPTRAEWDALETQLGCTSANKLSGNETGWECTKND
jgi:uncharacterized protein (TIGR02145 family)